MAEHSPFRAQFPFLMLSLLTGLTSSFVSPLMSYFLVDEIQVEPLYFSVYMVSVTLSGLVISQYFGYLADKGMNANRLYGVTMLCIGMAMFCFMIAEQFWQVFLAGILFMSVGAGAVSQMLTVSGLWAKTQNIDIPAFNARIRAGISLAWVIGPPLAFSLVAGFGFAASFSVALICVAIAAVFVITCVPAQIAPVPKQPIKIKGELSLSFWLVGCAVVVGMAGAVMYVTSMPLYVMRELNLPENLPGLMMGLVAALEIPIMLFAARLTRIYSTAKVMLSAFGFACCFYICVYFADNSLQLLSVQILNALFYGLYAGVALTLLQKQAPDLTGFTSAFYANATRLGIMFGTIGSGMIAQFFSFRAATLGSLAMAVTGLLILLVLIFIQREVEPSPQSETKLR